MAIQNSRLPFWESNTPAPFRAGRRSLQNGASAFPLRRGAFAPAASPPGRARPQPRRTRAETCGARDAFSKRTWLIALLIQFLVCRDLHVVLERLALDDAENDDREPVVVLFSLLHDRA